MGYTRENFEEWIILIPFKMEYFTDIFARENNLKLDYSMESLDELEKWILSNYKDAEGLIKDKKMLDYLTVYIGETFRKYKGVTSKSPLTYATACISRNKGDYISTILRNNMEH